MITPMPTKLFDAATEALMVELYRSGMPQTEIAKRYGCNPTTISNLMRRLGLARGRGYGRSPAMAWRHGDRAVALYQSGLSVEEISREIGVVSDALKKVLSLRGIAIERRPRSRSRHPDWNGGRYVNDRGYVEVIDDDPRFASMRGSDGYTPEHRLVMAKSLGRPLKRYETVHHIDGNRENNALANLELRQGKHGNGVRFVCLDCGSHNVEALKLSTKE